jgi:hypothetical protein
MRYRDVETERAEKEICELIGCEHHAAEGIFTWAWNLAVDRQRAGLDRAKVVYMSILGDVLQRIARGDGIILTDMH